MTQHALHSALPPCTRVAGAGGLQGHTLAHATRAARQHLLPRLPADEMLFPIGNATMTVLYVAWAANAKLLDSPDGITPDGQSKPTNQAQPHLVYTSVHQALCHQPLATQQQPAAAHAACCAAAPPFSPTCRCRKLHMLLLSTPHPHAASWRNTMAATAGCTFTLLGASAQPLI